MTGYTVHTGSNDKFSAGWDQIFSAGNAKKGKKNGSDTKASGTAKQSKGESGSKKSKQKAKRGK